MSALLSFNFAIVAIAFCLMASALGPLASSLARFILSICASIFLIASCSFAAIISALPSSLSFFQSPLISAIPFTKLACFFTKSIIEPRDSFIGPSKKKSLSTSSVIRFDNVSRLVRIASTSLIISALTCSPDATVLSTVIVDVVSTLPTGVTFCLGLEISPAANSSNNLTLLVLIISIFMFVTIVYISS